jgi:imidazolonepropionase
LLTLAGPAPRVGPALRDLGILENGALAIAGERIAAVGTWEEVAPWVGVGTEVLDAGGRVVMPGFVDCHTHAVFAGSREAEFVQKIEGRAYLEILAAGGGILSTVRATRAATEEELTRLAAARLARMLEHGSTTVEIKSGYGLTVADELKILRVISRLAGGKGKGDEEMNGDQGDRADGEETPVSSSALSPSPPSPSIPSSPSDFRSLPEIVSTFLGAHAVPAGIAREEYVASVIEEMLPAAVPLAEYCDVFCEEGAFTLDETRRILERARAQGLRLKVHAGEFHALGAAGLCARMGGTSADHLDQVTGDEVEAMAESGTVAVFLPAVNFYLRTPYADARRFVDAGVPIALATDFNPGSAPTLSMPFVLTLACLYLRLHPAEAITAATLNAAHALDRSDRIGSLEPGKQADVIVLDAPNYESLPYWFGSNPVASVIRSGVQVFGCSGVRADRTGSDV